METTANTPRIVPVAGTIVEYGLDSFGKEPATYRVDAYLKRVEHKPSFGDDWIGEILFDSCREFNGSRMAYCPREEATHLSLSGICGALAPVEDCKVIRMVEWPQRLIEDAQASADHLGRLRQMIF